MKKAEPDLSSGASTRRRAPVVAFVAPAAVGIRPSAAMGYSGAARYSGWYAPMLAEGGFDVRLLAPADSSFDHHQAKLTRSRHAGTQSGGSFDRDERESRSKQYDQFVGRSLEEIEPDVVMLISPSMSRLTVVPERMRSRTVVCVHLPLQSYSAEFVEWIAGHPEVRLTAMTDLHRSKFGALRERVKTIRVGLPVGAYTPDYQSLNNATQTLRAKLPRALVGVERLITQIDRVGPDKGQLVGMRMFAESGLASEGFHLLLAGDHRLGQQAMNDPSGRFGPYALRVAQAMEHDPFLRGHVHHLPALTGVEVEDLYRASSAVLAPYGMRHEGWAAVRGLEVENPWYEPLGFSPLIAQSCGAPVVTSDHVAETAVEHGVTGWRVSDAKQGAHFLRAATELTAERSYRQTIHDRAQRNHDPVETAMGYASLICEIAQQERGISFEVDTVAVQRGVEKVEMSERAATTRAVRSSSTMVSSVGR